MSLTDAHFATLRHMAGLNDADFSLMREVITLRVRVGDEHMAALAAAGMVECRDRSPDWDLWRVTDSGRAAAQDSLKRLRAQPEVLACCPFCGGPPQAFIGRGEYPFGWLGVEQIDADDGTWASAHVFCHECGARGPGVEAQILDAEEYQELLAMAVRQWQDRDQRHGDLYASSNAEGRNLFPRPDEAQS